MSLKNMTAAAILSALPHDQLEVFEQSILGNTYVIYSKDVHYPPHPQITLMFRAGSRAAVCEYICGVPRQYCDIVGDHIHQFVSRECHDDIAQIECTTDMWGRDDETPAMRNDVYYMFTIYNKFIPGSTREDVDRVYEGVLVALERFNESIITFGEFIQGKWMI